MEPDIESLRARFEVARGSAPASEVRAAAAEYYRARATQDVELADAHLSRGEEEQAVPTEAHGPLQGELK